jgi:hypothetical protein
MPDSFEPDSFEPESDNPEAAAALADPGRLAALWRGVEVGATGNFRDKVAALAGGLGAAYQRQKDIRDQSKKFGPIPMERGAAYDAESNRAVDEAHDQALAENTAGTKQAFKEHPWIAGTGAALGTALPAAVTGLTGVAGKGASFASRLGSAAKAGAGIGAISGIGGSEAQSISGMAADALGNAAIGATAGLGGGLIGEGVGAVARPLASALKKQADELLAKQFMGLVGGLSEKIPGLKNVTMERAIQAAKDIRDMGFSPLWNRASDMVKKMEPVIRDIGEKIGAVIPGMDQKLAAAGRASDPTLTVNAMDLAQKVDSELLKHLRDGTPQDEALANKLEPYVLKLFRKADNNGSLPFSVANKYRQALDSNVYEYGQAVDSNAMKGGLARIRGLLHDEIMDKLNAAAQAVGSGDEAAQLAQLNRQYASSRIVQDAAKVGAARAAKRDVVGIKELGAILAGEGKSLTERAALLGMTKIANLYGPGALSSAARGASGLLEGSPASFARPMSSIGPTSGATVPPRSAALIEALRRRAVPAAPLATPTNGDNQ